IIMVGPGTGIAPFRAFVEERQATEAKGKNWLFFGDQHYLTDFLYQTEWQDYLADGILTKLDLAFSRDQKEKIYVQDRMRENAEELYAWIQEGASFYVCGDASRMATDVDVALHEIIEKEGGMSAEDAATFVKQLKKDKRYLRDVY
ncbi:MAG: sulfite reductase [NADPH] flavoprotein alpha-component, partial [Lentimonas sp.]